MPATKKYTFKILKWLGGIFLLFFILLAAAAWYFNMKYKPQLTEEIKAMVYTSTDSLYRISFKNVTTNVLTGKASLKEVKITPDTARFRQLITRKRAPNNLYTISLKKLLVKNFNLLDLYYNRRLHIDELIFEKPCIEMRNQQFDFNINKPTPKITTPYEFISKILEEFSIQNIRFKDASFKYVDKNTPQQHTFVINNLNITLKDLLINATSANDPKRMYLLKDVVINLDDYTYVTPDKFYSINFKQLDFRASNGKLRIKKFSLNPLYDEMKFGHVAGYAKDRFNVDAGEILFNGINLPLYIKTQAFRAKEMVLANAHIDVFNNNELPRSPRTNKIGRYPHQLLQKLPVPVLIEKIQIKSLNISYALFDKTSQQKGRISFDQTQGLISNLTNIPEIKKANPFTELRLCTYLMGQAKLDVDFSFDLLSDKGDFTYSGILKNTSARIMNRITRPLGLVQISRGNVDKLKFSFKADDYGARGKVNFWYYDLSLTLMRNDPKSGSLVRRGFLSLLANALIINDENPRRDGTFTTGLVNYNRPANTSFFNMIWKSLFLGIKYSVGITEEKQQEMRARISQFKSIKASRQLRKTKRMERQRQREQERIHPKTNQ